MKKVIFLACMLLSVLGVQAQTFDFGKGWEANLEAGANFSFHQSAWGKHGHEKSGNILVGGGYNLSEHVYLGMETGILLSVGNTYTADKNPGANLVPVLGDFRYTVNTRSNWRPFLEFRAGYGFKVNSKCDYKGYAIENYQVGLLCRVSETLDLRGSVGYYEFSSSSDNHHCKHLYGISVLAGVGMRF